MNKLHPSVPHMKTIPLTTHMAIWQTFYHDLHICIRNTVISVEDGELEFHSMLSLPSLETATEPTMTRSMETLSFRLIFLLCSFTPWNHTHPGMTNKDCYWSRYSHMTNHTQYHLTYPTMTNDTQCTPKWQTTHNTIWHAPPWQTRHTIVACTHMTNHTHTDPCTHIQQTTLKTTQYQQTTSSHMPRYISLYCCLMYPCTPNHTQYCPVYPHMPNHRPVYPNHTQHCPMYPRTPNHTQCCPMHYSMPNHTLYCPMYPSTTNHTHFCPMYPSMPNHTWHCPMYPSMPNHTHFCPTYPSTPNHTQYCSTYPSTPNHTLYGPMYPTMLNHTLYCHMYPTMLNHTLYCPMYPTMLNYTLYRPMYPSMPIHTLHRPMYPSSRMGTYQSSGTLPQDLLVGIFRWHDLVEQSCSQTRRRHQQRLVGLHADSSNKNKEVHTKIYAHLPKPHNLLMWPPCGTAPTGKMNNDLNPIPAFTWT